MRTVFVKLGDPSHRLPHPFNPASDFPAAGQTVDAEHPVWMQLIRDGSLIEAKPDPEHAPEPVSEPAPEAPAEPAHNEEAA